MSKELQGIMNHVKIYKIFLKKEDSDDDNYNIARICAEFNDGFLNNVAFSFEVSKSELSKECWDRMVEYAENY